MILLVMLVLVAAACSALVPPLARRAQTTMTPSTAVVVTGVAALVSAFGLGISLSALAIASLAAWGPIAREGHVSPGALHTLLPVPAWLGVGTTLLVAALLSRAGMRPVVMSVAFVRSARLCRDLPGDHPVVFTNDADIATLAGLPGRIIVGRQLFEGLDPADQRVVLAHEHSHLRQHHHLYVQAVELAAAANPLLAGVPDIVRLGIERWADEDAAAAHGIADRDVTARALARVAVTRQRLRSAATSPATIRNGALAVAALQVTTRVHALLQPAPRSRASRTASIAAVALMALTAGVFGMAHVNDLIEMAQTHLPLR